MYILLLTNKSNTQLYKMVIYDKPIKKATAKVNRMNPEHNKLIVKGDTKYLANIIEVIYKSMREPDFSFESDCIGIEIRPFIRSTHSYFNLTDDTMTKEKLLKEYYRLVKENKHNVFQYNLIKEPKGSKVFDAMLNYVENIKE